MRTSPCTHRAVQPSGSTNRAIQARACSERTVSELDALTLPETTPDLKHTPLRSLNTWTKWEKNEAEAFDARYGILPSFLFQRELLSFKAERDLLSKAQLGGPESDEARKTLIEANLRFVQYIAVRYSKLSTPSLGIEDLFQEGITGVNRAIDLFDQERSPTNRFTTYAASHIWAAMQKAVVSVSDTVYFPQRHRSAAWAILRIADRLTQTLGRDPTYGEISEESTKTHASLWITPNFISQLFAEGILQSHPPTENHFREHCPHLIAATDLPSPEDNSRTQELRRIGGIIEECCADFSPRDLEVLRMRFPLDSDESPKTFEEIGEHFGVSKQRVKQIESDALALLRKRLKRHGIRSVPE